MVHDHQRQQCLGDRRGADAHAGVVTAFGDDFGALAVHVYGLTRRDDGAGGLDADTHFQILARADAAHDAARVVAAETLGAQRIAMRGAALGHAVKTCANLHGLDGIQTHHGVGDVGVQAVIQGLAQAYRHIAGIHTQRRAAGVAALAQLLHVFLEAAHIGHGREEGVVRHMLPALETYGQLADLGHAGAELGAEFLLEPFLGHGTCGHGGRRQTCRGATAAARVADAVFLEIRIVGMARAKALGNVRVVLATLVGIADQQRNRRTRGLAFVDAGEDFHRIGFVALGHELAGAGAAAVQIVLDVCLAQLHARRATVNHTADGRAVGFTKIGNRENCAKGIAAHGQRLSLK